MEIIKLGIILCIFCVISAGSLSQLNSITSPIIEKQKKEKEEKARKEVLNFSKIDLLNIADGNYQYKNELTGSEIKLSIASNTLKGSIEYNFTDETQKGIAAQVQEKIIGSWGNIIDIRSADEKEKPFVELMLRALSNKFEFKLSNKIKNEKISFFECFNGDKFLGVVAKIAPAGYSGKIKALVGINKKGDITGVTILSHTETPGLGARMTELDPVLATSLKEKFKNKTMDINKPWYLGQYSGLNITNCLLTKDDSVNGKIDAITAATISSRALTNGVKDALKIFNDSYKSN